jgi:tripartite-type tricarboxylate transporter receptor subunit TctC
MRIRLPILISGAVLAVTQAAGQLTAAPAYPTKPIRLVVSGAPGTPPDVLARIVGEPLAVAFGKPVVVENRNGMTVGLGAVAKAAPDGHTIGYIGLPQTVAPSLIQDMPYDTAHDFAPVTQLTWTATILVVRPQSPMKTLADFVALAKARPGALTYASGGNGTPPHLAYELLKRDAGIEVRHVPYMGTAAGLAALMGEHVDVAFAGIATALPLITSGRIRALATAGAQRLPTLPDLPTIAELGFPGYHLNEWHGIVAPARTPPEVITRLATELARIVASPEIKARLAHVGLYTAKNLGPEALAALIRTETTRWGQIVHESGIRAD